MRKCMMCLYCMHLLPASSFIHPDTQRPRSPPPPPPSTSPITVSPARRPSTSVGVPDAPNSSYQPYHALPVDIKFPDAYRRGSERTRAAILSTLANAKAINGTASLESSTPSTSSQQGVLPFDPTNPPASPIKFPLASRGGAADLAHFASKIKDGSINHPIISIPKSMNGTIHLPSPRAAPSSAEDRLAKAQLEGSRALLVPWIKQHGSAAATTAFMSAMEDLSPWFKESLEEAVMSNRGSVRGTQIFSWVLGHTIGPRFWKLLLGSIPLRRALGIRASVPGLEGASNQERLPTCAELDRRAGYDGIGSDTLPPGLFVDGSNNKETSLIPFTVSFVKRELRYCVKPALQDLAIATVSITRDYECGPACPFAAWCRSAFAQTFTEREQQADEAATKAGNGARVLLPNGATNDDEMMATADRYHMEACLSTSQSADIIRARVQNGADSPTSPTSTSSTTSTSSSSSSSPPNVLDSLRPLQCPGNLFFWILIIS
jgi:hypothetical protein